MKVLTRRFNIYLALAVLAGLAAGCTSSPKKTQMAALRVHIEVPADPTGTTRMISVLRSDPVLVSIGNNPILTEANMLAARVIDAQGGFAVEVRYDENGTYVLEQYSAANPGRHFVIFGQWGETQADGRWLAAPLITRRLSDGVLAFTPDCSREEADQMVTGLNDAATEIHKHMLK
jgi:hypothetical protein